MRAEQAKKKFVQETRKRKAATPSSSPSTAHIAEHRSPTALTHPNFTTEHTETYNAETVRLLDAVLDPSSPRPHKTARLTAPGPQVEALTTGPLRRSARHQSPVEPANANLVAASSATHGSGGIDRAWEAVGEMIKKRHRRDGGDGGDGGEFLLIYCGK
jgi:hypothetical protein